VKQFDLGKADLPQEIKLPGNRSGRVFFVDVGEDLVAIAFPIQRCEVVTIARLHQFVDGSSFVSDHVSDLHTSSWLQQLIDVLERNLPVCFISQVMQDGGGKNDVEGCGRQFGGSEVF
jgi:hypothetical protein